MIMKLIAIITPDKDIISNSDKYSSSLYNFNNYEQILNGTDR